MPAASFRPQMWVIELIAQLKHQATTKIINFGGLLEPLRRRFRHLVTCPGEENASMWSLHGWCGEGLAGLVCDRNACLPLAGSGPSGRRQPELNLTLVDSQKLVRCCNLELTRSIQVYWRLVPHPVRQCALSYPPPENQIMWLRSRLGWCPRAGRARAYRQLI